MRGGMCCPRYFLLEASHTYFRLMAQVSASPHFGHGSRPPKILFLGALPRRTRMDQKNSIALMILPNGEITNASSSKDVRKASKDTGVLEDYSSYSPKSSSSAFLMSGFSFRNCVSSS